MTTTANIFYAHVMTPLGQVLLVSDGHVLTGIYFTNQKHERVPTDSWKLAPDLGVFKQAHTQLLEYMAHERTTFDLPIRFTSGTLFQEKVWEALQHIPHGKTVSYAGIARAIGNPKSVRAVGTAVGRNPFTVVVPCHRVIGSDGSLTGYAGGLERKRALLAIEQQS